MLSAQWSIDLDPSCKCKSCVSNIFQKKWMVWDIKYQGTSCSVSVKFCLVSFLFCTVFAVTSDLNLKVICLQALRGELTKLLSYISQRISNRSTTSSLDNTTNTAVLQTLAQWLPDIWLTPKMWICEQQQKQTCWQEISSFKWINPLTVNTINFEFSKHLVCENPNVGHDRSTTSVYADSCYVNSGPSSCRQD